MSMISSILQIGSLSLGIFSLSLLCGLLGFSFSLHSSSGCLSSGIFLGLSISSSLHFPFVLICITSKLSLVGIFFLFNGLYNSLFGCSLVGDGISSFLLCSGLFIGGSLISFSFLSGFSIFSSFILSILGGLSGSSRSSKISSLLFSSKFFNGSFMLGLLNGEGRFDLSLHGSSSLNFSCS